MTDPTTIEARLAAVEAAVAALRKQVGPPPAATNWVDALPKVSDPEALDEAMRLAREASNSQRPGEQQVGPPPASAHWIDSLPNITDDDAFREAMRLGRELCNGLPPDEASGEAA